MKQYTAIPLLAAGVAKGFVEAAMDNPNIMLIAMGGVLGGRKTLAKALLLHATLRQIDVWYKGYNRNAQQSHVLMVEALKEIKEPT